MLIKTFQIINEFQLFFLCNLLVAIQTRVAANTPIQAHFKKSKINGGIFSHMAQWWSELHVGRSLNPV